MVHHWTYRKYRFKFLGGYFKIRKSLQLLSQLQFATIAIASGNQAHASEQKILQVIIQ